MQFSVNEHEKISLAFEKTTKFHEPVGRVWLVVFKKIASAYLHQIAREIMLFLINSLHEKGITDSQDRRNFDSASAICQFEIVLQLCTRFTGKIHSFLANQKRVIFSSILLHELSGSATRDRFYHTVSFGLLLMWTSWTISYSLFSWKVLKGNQHSLHFSFQLLVATNFVAMLRMLLFSPSIYIYYCNMFFLLSEICDGGGPT